MGLLAYYRSIPASPGGWLRHDVSLAALDVTIRTGWRVLAVTRTRMATSTGPATRTLTVTDRRTVAHDQDVVALTLRATGDGTLPRWRPGAHLDVILPSGAVRQYSLCSDPDEPEHYRIAVRRIPDGAGGSVEVHDALPVGATVHTHGPRNAFPFAVPGFGSPAQRLRFIAGGIGITPILPMLRLAHRLDLDWSMIYTGRSRDALPFLDELEGFGAKVTVRTDDTAGVPTAGDLLGECPDGTAVYACGPPPMLTAISAALADRRGVELHTERFSPPPVIGGSAFTVRIPGADIPVGADESVLAALGRAGVTVPYSCRQGFCGTCRTRVLDGAVAHHDSLLTDAERADGQMLICVSRAVPGSDLTLAVQSEAGRSCT